MKRQFCLAVVAALLAGRAVLAQNGPDNDPDGLRGYVDNVFHHSSVDSVNLYNGLLTVPIALGPSYPIGPKLKFQAMITYGSRVNEYGHPPVVDPNFTYYPYSGDPSLGLGWTFTLGAIKNCSKGMCYVGADGSQHIFDLSVGSGYLKTSDAAPLMLHDMGSGGPYEMWDADGNHSVFDWQVTGNDDNLFNYTHDFGRGRDGWYLRSLTDPFGNGMTVTYRQNVVPCVQYVPAGACPSLRMTCSSTVVNSWLPSSINLPTGTINVGVDANNRLSSFGFPVLANGSSTTATWSLLYQTATANQTCDAGGTYTVSLPQLQSIQLPGSLGAYVFDYAVNCGGPLLNRMTLPTGAYLDYFYGLWSFYHGRVAALDQNCHPRGPAAGALVEVSGVIGCGTPHGAPNGLVHGTPLVSQRGCADESGDPLPAQYIDQQWGVARRNETVNGQVHTTDYTQFAFPFGENGSSPTSNCDGLGRCGNQSLTVVTFPADVDGRRRAHGTLFWSGPKNPSPGSQTYAGDRTSADIEERVYDTDPTQSYNVAAMPVCGGSQDNPFCANHAFRVTQRTYEYDIPTSETSNRRLQIETTNHSAMAANGICLATCIQHTVTYSPTGTSWEANGRNYSTETHSGTLGNDSRSTTTVWTPHNWTSPTVAGGTVLPGLFSNKTQSDATLTVNRIFDFNAATGFLNCSIVYDQPRQHVVFNRKFAGTDGTVAQEFTASAYPYPSQPPPGACTSFYQSPPTAGGPPVGTNNDAFGKIYTYQNGRLTSTRWINGNAAATWYATRYDRDVATGWITNSYDTGGISTAYKYDVLGRVTSVAPTGEATTTVNYPSLTATTASRSAGTGLVTYQEYDYDGLGRLDREIHSMPSSLMAVRTHAFDGPGHPYFDSEWASCTNAAGDCQSASPAGSTSSNFDPFGRAQTATRADGSSTTVSFADTYAAYSDTKKTVTATHIGGSCTGGGCSGGSSAQTVYTSDAFGRMTSVIEPGGDLTAYGYDLNGKLTSVSQGAQSRSFVYDPNGFLVQETTPERGTTTYTCYGSLGNLELQAPPGLQLGTTYDYAGRVMTVRSNEDGSTLANPCTGGSLTGGRLYVTNTYDAGGGNGLGRLTSRIGYSYETGATYSVTDGYAYNGVGGRLSARTSTVSGSNLSATQTWLYNGLGLVAHSYHPRTSGQTPFAASWDFDAGVPVREYANGIPVVKNVSYRPSGSLSAYTTGFGFGTDVTTTIAEDTYVPRPSSITTAGASTNLSISPYTYDGVGNITVMGADAFGYDLRSRLTSATLSGLGNQGFSYDRYGNMLTKGASTYTVDAAHNRVTSFLTGSVTTPVSYSADGRGNVTGLGGDVYGFDGLDRMAFNRAGSAEYDYVYDGSGERVVKVPPGSGPWTYTFRDEGNRIATEISGTSVWRDDLYLGTNLVASESNGSDGPVWTFYASDHLGTPRLVTNVAGTTVEMRKSWPYGEDAGTQGIFQRVRFAGMERDAEGANQGTGGSRFYDHARSEDFNLGRFLSPDPTVGVSGDPQTWNRYAYVRGNPIRNIDPTGEADCDNKGWAECAALTIDERLQEARQYVDSHTNGNVGGITLNFVAGTLTDVGRGMASNLNAGSQTGEAFGRGADGFDKVKAVAQDTGKLSTIALTLATVANAMSPQTAAAETPASTPTGRLGSPMDVKPGTNSPATIGNRLYSGHSLDQMQGRGMMPSVVEDTIQRGAQTVGRGGAKVFTTEQAKVILNQQGKVVTVMPQ